MQIKYLIFIIFYPFLLGGGLSQGGRTVLEVPYETEGEKHWFVTTNGNGDCKSWRTACSFRTAVSYCSSTYQDVIHLGEGSHDTDNGVDGNGTTISVDGVTVKGLGSSRAANARLINSNAAAAIVLKVTGDGFNIINVDFDNTGQTDENVIFLNTNGAARGEIRDCNFVQDSGAGGGVGILFDGATTEYYVQRCLFNYIVGSAIKTNSMTQMYAENLFIAHGGTGIDLTGGVNDSHLYFFDLHIREQTLGISIAASITDISFSKLELVNNTTNITDNGDWGGITYQHICASYKKIQIYPANAGTSVNTGDGAWVWTAAATTIIPADTIQNPFYITRINVQDADPSQTFEAEIFYGEAVASTSLGLYEFTVGPDFQNVYMPTYTPMVAETVIPANSIVGIKLKSSTAGVDSATLTISYQEF